MTLSSRVNQMFIYDSIVDNTGKLTPNCINWFNQLTEEVNSILKYGRDSVGLGATNQKSIPFVEVSEMNTATRDSVAGVGPAIIYNTDTNKFQGFANGVWVDFH